jgi:plastocyanin
MKRHMNRRDAIRLAAVLALATGVTAGVCRAADVMITQHNLHFSQTAVEIRPGDTLKFTNDDDVIHNIGVRGGDDEDDTDDLGLQKPGVIVSYKFTRAGFYSIVCSIHPRMRMKVAVK